jgi:[ribosomal protein S5]-alanine N-acetyltransferase
MTVPTDQSRQLPTLVTTRLLLRPFAPADGSTVEQLAGDFAVADTTLYIPHPYPAGAGAVWIATHNAEWDSRTVLTLAITQRVAPSDIIGAIALKLVMQHSQGEIGYWIGRPFWGHGFATEAARAVTDFGFNTLGLRRVEGCHFTRNAPSGRVLQKLGMHREGVRRDAYFCRGKFEDVVSYAIIASDRT